VVLRDQPHSTGLYIAQYLFVVLSVRFRLFPSYTAAQAADIQPCAFLAGDYILLGRIVSHLNAPQYIRPFKPGKISWTFVISDGTSPAPDPSFSSLSACAISVSSGELDRSQSVLTFLIQAAGGGLSISDNIKTAQAGGHIFLAGIAAQMASFLLFTLIWAMFAYRA
jgi:hypothetical protein